jgi:hypothetical protein
MVPEDYAVAQTCGRRAHAVNRVDAKNGRHEQARPQRDSSGESTDAARRPGWHRNVRTSTILASTPQKQSILEILVGKIVGKFK